jgi:tetratricopeptide (TPR) repeat protein
MASELKDEGNAHFAAKRYQKAVESYTKGLDLAEDSELRAILYSNRSAAHLDLRNFKDAVHDATEAVKANPTWPKGHSRLAAALGAIKDYEGAAAAAAKAASLDPSSSELKKAATIAAKIAESEREERLCRLVSVPDLLVEAAKPLDLQALRKKAEAPDAPENLIERFIKPHEAAINLQTISGKGRGVVAAHDFKAGEEVASENAIAWYPQFGDVIGAAIPGLLEIAPSFSSAGGDFYAFCTQLEPFASYLPTTTAATVSLSKAEVAMRASRQNGVGACFDESGDTEEARIICFSPFVAMLNHDCCPNARVSTFWDSSAQAPKVRVFAVSDIKKGDEVVIRYCEGTKTKAERQADLRRYDFGESGCSCRRCTQPFEDTIAFCCLNEGCKGRIFGNSETGACDANEDHKVDPSLVKTGGEWDLARTRYLSTARAGMESYPSPTSAATPDAARIPRITILDLVLKHNEPEMLAKHHTHLSDCGRMDAIYTSIGKGSWLLDAKEVLKAYRVFLPYFTSVQPTAGFWLANAPQLNILAGHIAVAAKDTEAAKASYSAAHELYKAFFGESSGHPFLRLTASCKASPPKNRSEVEKLEIQRLHEGSYCAMGLSRKRAGKWLRPLDLAGGGSGSGANEAAGDERRLIEELQRLTAKVLGTKLGQTTSSTPTASAMTTA